MPLLEVGPSNGQRSGWYNTSAENKIKTNSGEQTEEKSNKNVMNKT
jgi:hypothetical protein